MLSVLFHENQKLCIIVLIHYLLSIFSYGLDIYFSTCIYVVKDARGVSTPPKALWAEQTATELDLSCLVLEHQTHRQTRRRIDLHEQH